MAEYVLMPQKGLTEESAILAEWHVKKGDTVKKGDYLFDIETGKAVFSIESEADGTVLETFGQAGDEILIKQVVCIIGQPGEAIELPAGATPAVLPAASMAAPATPAAPPTATPIATPTAMPVPAASAAAAPTASAGGIRIFASPKAKAVAAERGIDLAVVPPSGPGGRIVRDDVLRTARGSGAVSSVFPAAPLFQSLAPAGTAGSTVSGATAAAAAVAALAAASDGGTPGSSGMPFTVVRNSNIRKVIARNMHQSLQQMAQLTLFASFDATTLLEVRDRLKARSEAAAARSGGTGSSVNITVNDMIVFAVSRTILGFPTLNAHFDDEGMTLFHDAHIGIAVDTKNGLLVPTVFNANRLSLRQIAEASKRLAAACQEGKATPLMLGGATFTTTNLGALRIEAFTPIVAPPQTAILGIGCIDFKVRKAGAEFVHYPAIGLSLTFDHRAVDGAPAARFLKALIENLEDYLGLLAE